MIRLAEKKDIEKIAKKPDKATEGRWLNLQSNMRRKTAAQQ